MKGAKKTIAFLLSLAMIFTFAFGTDLFANSVKAEGESSSDTFTLYYYYEGTEELYMNIWNHAALTFTDSDTTDLYFSWSNKQAKLKAVDGKENWYSVELKVVDSTLGDGISIYNAIGDSGKLIDFDSEWNNTTEYAKLFTGKSAYKIKDSVISDDVAEITGASDSTDDGKTTDDDSKDTDDSKNADDDTDKKDDTNITYETLPTDINDAIRGMDVSSYYALQQGFDELNKEAGKEVYGFKDSNGNIIKNQAFFNFLASQGVNYIRLRVWNDPYDSNGNGYGGGNNDIEKAKIMGQYATKAGMKVLIDFHFSDFWTDPNKQQAPKAWADMNNSEKAKAISTFTTSSLNTLLNAGVDVGMVQIGNETNGKFCGVKFSDGVDELFDAGCDAVHSVANSHGKTILAAVHFANPEKAGAMKGYAKTLSEYDGDADGKNEGVSYDVFASSYYPYWHGSLSNLNSVLSEIAHTYDKKVMVAETSYANTLLDFDGHDNTVRKGTNDTGADLLWEFNTLGQAKEFQAVEATVRSISDKDGNHAGLGAFYWEGAWINLVDVQNLSGTEREEAIAKNKSLWEKYGAGWAASYSVSYEPDDAGKWYGGSAVDNQAFFGPDGMPLQSISTFSPNYTDFEMVRKISSIVCDETLELQIGSTLDIASLPNATTTYNDYSSETVSVNWNADDISAVNEKAKDVKNTGKTLEVKGCVTADEKNYEVSCFVKLIPKNMLSNPSFEDGVSEWTGTVDSEKIDLNTNADIKLSTTDVKTGTKGLHFWKGSDYAFTVSRDVKVETPGKYEAGIYVQGGYGDDSNSDIKLSLSSGETTASSENLSLNGWKNWVLYKASLNVTSEMIKENGGVLTITLSAKLKAGAWGTIDDAELNYLCALDSDDSGKDDGKDDDSGKTDNGKNSSSDNSGSTANSSSSNQSDSSSSNSGTGSSSSTAIDNGSSTATEVISKESQTLAEEAVKNASSETRLTAPTATEIAGRNQVSTVVVNATENSDGGIKKNETYVKEDVKLVKNAISKKSKKKKSVTIDMLQGANTPADIIPSDVLSTAKGKNIDVTFDMGDYSWTINGKSIKKSGLKDINLKLIGSASDISEKQISRLAKGRDTYAFSLAHKGNLLFTTNLNMTVDKKYKGKTVRLYYLSNGKLKYESSGKVGKDGSLSLKVKHASEYVIVFSK